MSLQAQKTRIIQLPLSMSLCDSKSHNLSHPKATSGCLGLHIGNVVPVQEWGGESFVLRRHSCRFKLPGEKPTLACAWSNGVVAKEANGSSQVDSKFHNQWQSWGLAQQWPNHDVNIQYCPSIVYLLNFWIPPSFILSNSFGTGIDRIQHAPGGAHRPFTAGNRLQLVSSHLWSGAMWLHTLPRLTWQSWQKETLQTWYILNNKHQQLWLKNFSTPCNGNQSKSHHFPSNFHHLGAAITKWLQ